MQTEEPKRKPYDAVEKEKGGSCICSRALNALLEAVEPCRVAREYICIYLYIYMCEKTVHSVVAASHAYCHCIKPACV